MKGDFLDMTRHLFIGTSSCDNMLKAWAGSNDMESQPGENAFGSPCERESQFSLMVGMLVR